MHGRLFRLKTYSRVFSAAGKGDATSLSTCIGVRAVEVDVEVPIICSKGPTALPLEQRRITVTGRINTINGSISSVVFLNRNWRRITTESKHGPKV